jgi:phenylacetate-CoA ligase
LSKRGKHLAFSKFIFSAEGFSEEFRSYIAENAKLKNIYKDTLNHYGTVDIGTKAYETPISILIRRLALGNKGFYNKIFRESKVLPTLAQFIPEQFYFEVKENILICSSDSGIPLIRYDLKDLGGVLKFSEMVNLAKESGIDLKKEIKKAGIINTIWELPFVYISGRSDSSVSLYGSNIYPETIRFVLLDPMFRKYFSGRVSMQIVYSKKQNPKFKVHVELKNNCSVVNVIRVKLEQAIFDRLKKENAEYYNNFKVLGKKVYPSVVCWEYGNKQYFSRAGKHKWIIK